MDGKEQSDGIEYRAWNGYAKQMYDVDLLHIRNRLPGRIPELNHDILQSASLVYQPKIILMQYSRLKDINGVKIFEDDVVYLAGYGNYLVKFPFTELYEAAAENDIGAIKGNIHQNEGLF